MYSIGEVKQQKWLCCELLHARENPINRNDIRSIPTSRNEEKKVPELYSNSHNDEIDTDRHSCEEIGEVNYPNILASSTGSDGM